MNFARGSLATCGTEAKINFGSGDSVQSSGWDGQCVVVQGSGPVPGGASGWEIGCQRHNPRGKADDDYQKRVDDPLGLEPSETTFVFVTPRRWPAKTKWAATRREEGHWRDVTVIDADDLVHWLELHPDVGHWLAVKIGKRPQGLSELSEHWDRWSLATNVPLPPNLILRGRDGDAARVMRWLQGPPTVLSVQAEAVEEAIAFLYAAISELPSDYRQAYLSRALVPSDEAGALALADAPTPLILVLRNSSAGLPQTAALRGHHVFVAFGPDSGVPSDVLTLARPRRHLIEQALEEMNIPRQEAHNLARDSGRSLTVLRRLMPPAPGQRPTWIQTNPPRSLVAALLAGGWRETVDGDRAAIEALAGVSYPEVARDLAPLLAAFDGPLRKSGDAWKVASPRDAWFLLARFITHSDLDRYLKVLAEVLGEEDPRYDLSSHDRWMAGLRGIGLTRSGLLRLGLTETLILLSAHGNQARQISDPVAIVDAAVARLLGRAEAKLWWSLQGDFERLAEASPSAFLDALRKALKASPTPLGPLFTEDDGGVSGQEYLSNLLWGLERLAWDPDLLPQVAHVLAALDAIDSGGRYANRPANTLRQIFHLWDPQTHATLTERLRVIDGLRKRWPKLVWRLLLAISPKPHDTWTPNAFRQWRDFAVDRPETVTPELFVTGAKAVTGRLLEDVGQDAKRWRQLIEVFSNFDSDLRLAVGRLLKTTVPLVTDPAERKIIRDALRRTLHHQREFPDAVWSVPETELGDLQTAFELLVPDDFVEAHDWLFKGGAGPDRPAPGGWQAAAAHLEQLQLEAVAEIADREGRDGVLRLARAAEQPRWIGQKVMMLPETEVFRDELLKVGLQSDGREWDLAHGMLLTAANPNDLAFIRRVLKRAQVESWGERAETRVLLAAPGLPEVWALAGAAGPTIENAYWKQIETWRLESSADDFPIAIEMLLSVGRARHAVNYIGSHPAEGIPEKLTVRALGEAVNDGSGAIDHNEATMFTYNVGELLNYLDSKVDRSDIIELEWAYYQILRFSQRPPRRLEQALATEPNFFIQILSAAYPPSKESGIVEPEPDDEGKAGAVAAQAWSLLREWKWVPGADADGVVDASALQKWVAAVRALAAACGRLEVCDSRIGHVLAASRPDADGTWPPTPIRNMIEQHRSTELENGICAGIVNHRGVTTRLATDGGALERALAQRYRKDAKAVATDWPQTAALLERIAKDFEADGRREDQSVEVLEWM